MIASELFELIRKTLGTKPRIRNDGKVSVAIYPNGLINICTWGGEGKAWRPELVHSTEMPLDCNLDDEVWLPDVLELCEWERSRKGAKTWP